MGSPRRPDAPASIDRRRLLVALGFGAANVLALRSLEPLQGMGGADGTGASGEGTAGPAPSLAGAAPPPAPDHQFDTVISGGRVVDPDSGFDATANVGIDGSVITSITSDPIDGRTGVDAAGRVVAPGFIDILSYDPNPYGVAYKVADGVTTNLGMHGLNAVASEWFERWESEGVATNFGGAFDNPFMRDLRGVGTGEAATSAQVDQLVADAEEGLSQGWIGLDFEPEYTPGIEYEEIRRLAEVASRYGVPCFFHGRYSDMTPPGTNVETLEEILRVARDTGAGVHVQHITSTGGTFSMEQSLATLQAARDEGLDVTACLYPYDFWATYLGSPRFEEGWQERFRIGYDDLVIAGTGERLTAATFERYRAQNRLAAAYAIPEEDVRTALRSPFTLIGSDAILEPGNNNHPRSTGCFARTLGRYARDLGVVPLVDALAKMTILPARRLEAQVPALRRKGRLQRGADADITVFDPALIADRSTIENPAQLSVGVDWVLVNGQVVKNPDGVDEDARPGLPIRPQFA